MGLWNLLYKTILGAILYLNTTWSFIFRQRPLSADSPNPPPTQTKNSMSPSTEAKRRALLIACTYKGVVDPREGMHPLPNSWRDPDNIRNVLLKYGWSSEEITILADTDEDPSKHPTRANMIKHLKELVEGGRAGGISFLSYSGHGDQLEAGGELERGQKDESNLSLTQLVPRYLTCSAIYPCDYLKLKDEGKPYFINDNVLREIVIDGLPEGSRLLAVIDCCSSGTMLDLPIVDRDLSQNPGDPCDDETGTSNPSASPVIDAARRSLDVPIKSSTDLASHYLQQRRLSPTNTTMHLLPLMTPRGTDGLILEAVDVNLPPQDTRVIKANVMCIASCEDSGQTFETNKGGVLIQAWCDIMLEAKEENQALKWKTLKFKLREAMRAIHTKKAKKKDDSETPPPSPQFSFSHKHDCDSIFSVV